MKKSKLAAVYDFDFDLIGIVSSAKEYKLAWSINQLNFFHLTKADDIIIEFAGNKQIRISNLKYEDDYSSVHLLRNKLAMGNSTMPQYLLPELNRFDYLLKLNSQLNDRTDELVSYFKHVPVVDYAVKIEVEKIKLKENLLF